MKLLFLIPSFEPGHCGVGDYTRRFAGELIRRGHQSIVFSMCDKSLHLVNSRKIKAERFQSDNDTNIGVMRHSENESWASKFTILAAIIKSYKPDLISLQYVPHGFHRKGLPYAFAKGLSSLPQRERWHIMLHELWSGYGSLFELRQNIISFCQRQILARILNTISPSLITTSTSTYQQRLRFHDVKLLPLFSNVAVSTNNSNGVNRDVDSGCVNAGLFGAFSSDKAGFRRQLEVIVKIAESNNRKTRLALMGRRTESKVHLDIAHEIFGADSVVDLGSLPERELSEALKRMDIGVSRGDVELFPKSGSTLAFLEHGVPVLLRGDRCTAQDLEQSEYRSLIHFCNDSFSGLPTRAKPRSGVSQVAERFLGLIESIV